MNRVYIFHLLIVILLCNLACGGTDDKKSSTSCPNPTLEIKNTSEFTLLDLIKHSTEKYYDNTNKIPKENIIDENIAPDKVINHAVTANESTYFTFIRNISSTVDTPVAFTTSEKIKFEACYRYYLHILEEGFYLQTEYVTSE